MVEAAAVFPLVIISVTVLIYMMAFFYGQLNERVDVHIVLRSESGKLCDNMSYQGDVREDVAVYKKTHQIYSNSSISSKYNVMLKKRKKEIAARKYLIDECAFIRSINAAKDWIVTDE